MIRFWEPFLKCYCDAVLYGSKVLKGSYLELAFLELFFLSERIKTLFCEFLGKKLV